MADSQVKSGQKPGKPGPPPRVDKTGPSPARGGPGNLGRIGNGPLSALCSSLLVGHIVILDNGRGGQNVPVAWAQCGAAQCPHARPAQPSPARPSLDSQARQLSPSGRRTIQPFQAESHQAGIPCTCFSLAPASESFRLMTLGTMNEEQV